MSKYVWGAEEIEVTEWLCRTCKWWNGGRVCRAFPDGMPEEIWTGKVEHREPYPGDNGIQYEPKS